MYRITVGGGRSTEELVAAGGYGYAHSAVISQNFPVRVASVPAVRGIVLVHFGRELTTAEALEEAARYSCVPPTYEDALHFGAQHPGVQSRGRVVFLHPPWVGYFGRRDVLCLWSNAGRRELGLEDYDGRWGADCRFAFQRKGGVTAGSSRDIPRTRGGRRPGSAGSPGRGARRSGDTA
jgi:hypothetical protein